MANLGKVTITPRGVYNPATPYVKLDCVSYNGSSWLALTSSTGITPVEGANWTLLAQGFTSNAASGVSYSNTASGLTATNAQTAIDELNTNIDEVYSYTNIKKTVRFDADSFGDSGGTVGKRFASRVAKSRGLTLDDKSLAGQLAYDGWLRIKEEVSIPSPYDMHLIHLGVNDARKYGNLQYVEKQIAHELEAIIALLRCGVVKDDSDSSITYVGNWIANQASENYKGGDHYTGEQGAYAEFQFTGNTLYIGTYFLVVNGARLQVQIDGVTKYDKMNDNEACYYTACGAIVLDNLGDGTHTCKFINATSNGSNYIYLDWYGTPSAKPPVIVINGLTKMRTDMYAQYPPYNNASDAVMNLVNEEIRKKISQFDERVIFVDQSSFDANNCDILDTDHVHPNNYGHMVLADNILKRI